MDDYLTKPLDRNLLIGCLEKLFGAFGAAGANPTKTQAAAGAEAASSERSDTEPSGTSESAGSGDADSGSSDTAY